MLLKNIESLPESAKNVLMPYLEKLSGIYSHDIISIFVYGSVAGPNYDPRYSDINVAVVMRDASARMLSSAARLVRWGLRRKITAPLFIEPHYIKLSLDTFPIEFMNMKDSRIVLYGDDLLADVTVKREDLRKECEYQLKGKILTIRQAYLEQALRSKDLERLIKDATRSLLAVFKGMLRIKGIESLPRENEEIITRIGSEFNVDISPFLEVLNDIRTNGHLGGKTPESFIDSFLSQLEHMASVVDNMR